nr:hypothetical protein RSP673_21580 [Ralstonia solanacearum P673]
MQQLMLQQQQTMIDATNAQNQMTVTQTACKLIEQGPKAARDLIQ